MKANLITVLVWASFMCLCFSAHADANIATLVSFTGTNGPNLGANPYAEVVQGSDGNFYGTTAAGGSNNLGTVFCMKPNGVLTSLVSFSGTNGLYLGSNPYGGLVQAGSAFYGATRNGGSNNLGTAFRITTNGVLTTLATFNGTNGSAPLTGLLLASDGYLYGTTFSGGVSNKGTIFQMTTNGALNVLVSFPGGTNGNAPEAGLAQGMDGNLYGTTFVGGNLFQAKTNGAITNLLVFTGTSGSFLGRSPHGKLVQDAYGNLFGTTYQGGTFDTPIGWGTVFMLTTNGAFNVLHNFDSTNGANLNAGVILGKDGNLYGTTVVGGGPPPLGTVFQLTTNGIFTPLFSFDYNANNSTFPHGASPYGGLVQGTDGNYYGTAEVGGAAGYGTIFRISLQPVFQSVIRTNGLFKLNWSSISNKTYQLSYKTNLTVANWQNLGSLIVATNGTMSTSDNSGTDSQRFYRLQLLP